MQIMKFATIDDQTPRVGVVQGDAVVAVGRGELVADRAFALGRPDGTDRGLLASSNPTFPDRIRFGCSRRWTSRKSGVPASPTNGARSRASKNQTRAASFYDLVYRADRPELFFKATPSRVVGPGQPIRVRRDSNWCVPEPELALVLSPALALVGFTAGNDMSARDIEGENPLYLPQAKVYDSCCALGPVHHAGRGHAAPRLDRHPPGDRARRHHDL